MGVLNPLFYQYKIPPLKVLSINLKTPPFIFKYCDYFEYWGVLSTITAIIILKPIIYRTF